MIEPALAIPLIGEADAPVRPPPVSTARNTAAILIATLISRGIQFIWVLGLARLLSPADFGIYGTIGGLIATAAVIPEFGMGLVVLRDVAQRPADSGRYLSAVLVMQPLLALVGYVALLGVGLLLPNDTPTRILLALAALSLIVDTYGNLYYSQLIALEKMVATSTIQVIHVLILIVFVFVAVSRGGGLGGLYIATIVAGLFRVALHWIAAHRAGIQAQWPIDRAVVSHLLRDGWSIMAASLVRVAYQHIDKVIALAVLGDAMAGYLTAAFVIVFGVTELLNTTVLVALFPLMSRLGRDDAGALWRLTDRLALLTIAASLPIAIGISTLAVTLSAWLFPGFSGTAGVLQVLIWHTVVVMVSNLYGQALVIRRRQRFVLTVRIVSLIINTALNLILLPRIGITGSAVAALIAESAGLVWLLIARQPDRPALLTLLSCTLRIGSAGAVMAIVLLALRTINPFLAVIVSVPIDIGLVWMLRGLPADDWTLIGTLIAAFIMRVRSRPDRMSSA